MIIVMLIAVVGGFMGSGGTNPLVLYLIPAYNSVSCMVDIFSFSASALTITVTVLVNLVVAGICTFVLTRMFGNERIMFSQ
jgi:hypothetical protein